MPARNRARVRAMLAESERLEAELGALTDRLVTFTAELQAQIAARTNGGDHAPADD